MITFYASANNGDICKCEFISMLYATYGWLALVMDNDKYSYKIITKKQFYRRKGKKIGTRITLRWNGENQVLWRPRIVGYYTKINKGR
jgi:hypothetical protein